jgi:hypothetical protein
MPNMVQTTDSKRTAYPNGRCWCGCGTKLADPTKFFVATHDRKAEARAIRERYGSIPNFLLAHGYGPDVP